MAIWVTHEKEFRGRPAGLVQGWSACPSARREPIAGHWLSDGQAIYGHLKQSRDGARIAVKAPPLAKGLISDARRGDVSPLGGQARPAPKPKGCKY